MNIIFHEFFMPHQWLSGYVLKTGRWEIPDSIPGHTCRPSRSEFSVVFSETPANTGKDPLERPHEGHSTYSPRSHK